MKKLLTTITLLVLTFGITGTTASPVHAGVGNPSYVSVNGRSAAASVSSGAHQYFRVEVNCSNGTHVHGPARSSSSYTSAATCPFVSSPPNYVVYAWAGFCDTGCLGGGSGSW